MRPRLVERRTELLMALDSSVQVDKDLRKMLIKSDAPKGELIGLRVWPKAIPQFNVGHQDLLEVGYLSFCLLLDAVILCFYFSFPINTWTCCDCLKPILFVVCACYNDYIQCEMSGLHRLWPWRLSNKVFQPGTGI